MMPKSAVMFLQYLYEMAKSKSDAEEKIGNLCVPITDHIVKVLKWEDNLNYHKHMNNIDNWFLETLRYTYNKKRPDQKTFYELLFEDRIDSVDMLNKIIKRTLSDYHSLPVIRKSNEEIYEIMRIMMWEICGDLSKKRYIDFEDYYFPKYSN